MAYCNGVTPLELVSLEYFLPVDRRHGSEGAERTIDMRLRSHAHRDGFQRGQQDRTQTTRCHQRQGGAGHIGHSPGG